MHRLLGQGHEDVPRAADLVHARDGLAAEGKGSDGLSAARPKDAVHASDVGSHQLQGRDAAVDSRRRRHVHLANAGHPRRDGRHQHRGGIDRRGAGHVHAHPLQRPHHLAEAALIEARQSVVELLLVVGPDAVGGKAQRPHHLFVDLRVGVLDLLRRHLQGEAGARLHAVDLLVVAPDRGVAALAHVGQDAVHHRLGVQVCPKDAPYLPPDGCGQLRLSQGTPQASQQAAALFTAVNQFQSRYSLTAPRP